MAREKSAERSAGVLDWSGLEDGIRAIQKMVELKSESMVATSGALAATVQQVDRDVRATLTQIEADMRAEYSRAMDSVAVAIKELPVRAGHGEQYALLSRAYVSRLVVSVLVFFIGGWFNSLCSTYAGWRTPRVVFLDLDGKPLPTKSLPDILHSLSGFLTAEQLEILIKLPDLFVAFTITCAIILILVHPKRLMIIRRTALIIGIINTLRGIAVVSTFLPDPSPRAQLEFIDESLGAYKRLPPWPEVWHRTVQRMILTPGNPPDVGDVCFSGHAAFVVSNWCLFMYYCRPGPASLAKGAKAFRIVVILTKLLRVFMTLVCFTGCVIIVCSRFHYTIDVAVAIFLTYQSFHVYHLLCESSRDRSKSNFLIRWLEHEEVLMSERRAYHQLVELVRKES
mmetsp:Transcript_12828/g.34535  ORF Transcript_12828/g.34535 Transcript_12828/m.34535 type:complete len:397 (-) Transcript_12828:506-1696(-)